LPANLIQPLPQGHNSRHHAVCPQVAAKVLRFGLQNCFCLGSGCFALASIVVHNVFKIVNVVEVDSVYVAHLGVNVARQSDIHNYQRLILVLAAANDDFSVLAAQDRVWTRGRTDNDVGLRHVLPTLFKGDRDPPEPLREFGRVVECPVDYLNETGSVI
jgi:hypothetical protein